MGKQTRASGTSQSSQDRNKLAILQQGFSQNYSSLLLPLSPHATRICNFQCIFCTIEHATLPRVSSSLQTSLEWHARPRLAAQAKRAACVTLLLPPSFGGQSSILIGKPVNPCLLPLSKYARARTKRYDTSKNGQDGKNTTQVTIRNK